MLVLAINGPVMYAIVGSCFAFAAANDLFIAPKYTRLKEKYKQFRNQDEYIALNEVKEDGTKR